MLVNALKPRKAGQVRKFEKLMHWGLDRRQHLGEDQWDVRMLKRCFRRPITKQRGQNLIKPLSLPAPIPVCSCSLTLVTPSFFLSPLR